MANVMYAWEFGANLGHIGTFLPIARNLRNKGHHVTWVVTHTHQASRLLPAENFDWFQAPVMPEQRINRPPLNYADILLRFGYGCQDDLYGLVVAWRALMQATASTIVLADHAPTAILAAKTLGLPVMLFGGGFFSPPQVHPTPNMRPWLQISSEELGLIDHTVLVSINSVLERFHKTPIRFVAELFKVEEDALLTFPELDHYENRGDAHYWGTLPAAVAAPPAWPGNNPVRIFAYLRPESAHFEAGLVALKQTHASILVFAPSISQATKNRFTSESMCFADTPVDLSQVASEAVAAVTYASPAATIAFLLAGKPVLMMPGHLEQFLFARRVQQMGAGLFVDPEKSPEGLPSMLHRVLHDPTFTYHARLFANKYSAFPQETIAANISNRIEELAS